MAKKLFRYNTELGFNFNPDSNPIVYIDGVSTEWDTKEVINVTPETTVDLWGYFLIVPENAAKMLKYSTDSQTMGVFLTSDNQLIDDVFGYIVKGTSDHIDFSIDCNDIETT